MEQLLNRLKDKLNENEYLALKKAAQEIKDPHTPTYFDVCFTCRFDTSVAYSIVNSLRKNITNVLSLCEYVASVKTLYLTDRNNRQNKECSYSVEGDTLLIKQALLTATANVHHIVKLNSSTDALILCKAIKLFDDLKFFATELKEDKTVYLNFKTKLENYLQTAKTPLSQSLISGYLALLSLENAESLINNFDNIFSSIKRTSKNTAEILFWSEKGLSVYGYNEQCENLRNWAIERYLASDSRFYPAIITEIIINN